MSPRTGFIIALVCCGWLMGCDPAPGKPDGQHHNAHNTLKTIAFHRSVESSMSRQGPCSTEQVFFHNGRITGKLIYWNNQPLERTVFEYLDDLSRYSVQTLVYHGHRLSLMRKDWFKAAELNNMPDQKIETWYYYFDKDRANSLRQVDIYYPDSALVKERQLFDESGGLKVSAIFEYDAMDGNPQYDEDDQYAGLNRMTLTDDEGRMVLDYKERTAVDIGMIYRKRHLPEPEIQRRIEVSRDSRRIPILIMDGGIDPAHPALAYKIWHNPDETLNGRDDDGNGLVDDLYGISDNPRLHQPVHDLRLPRYGLPPFSHGTLVASVAVKDREDVALMSAAELTAHNSNRLISLIERFIRFHQVRFVNMSFVLDRQLLGFDGNSERPLQIKTLIQRTPETLYVAAAGNGALLNGTGFNMDRQRKKEALIPAMLPHHNLLVVGALNTATLDYDAYPHYRMAGFSNFGEQSVDILAPGTHMCGAQMGGGTICKDGTSFAAPYVLNHGVLEVANANPALNIFQIKELLIKSAYIPNLDKPFAVRSGGILHPRRAVDAARWMASHTGVSVEQAVLAVRKTEPSPLFGEGGDDTYLEALKRFWTQRGIGNSAIWLAESRTENAIAAAMQSP